MNSRQRKFVKGYAEGKSATQAAKDAGYSSNGAGVQGHNLLKNPNVQAGLKAAMERAGITDERLAETILDGIEAITEKGHKDHTNRHRFLDTALKVRGDYAAERKEITGSVTLAQALEELEDGNEK